MSLPPLPNWAREKKYEWVVGMSIWCHNCGEQLREGQKVYVDDDYSDRDMYCSRACLDIADRVLDKQ